MIRPRKIRIPLTAAAEPLIAENQMISQIGTPRRNVAAAKTAPTTRPTMSPRIWASMPSQSMNPTPSMYPSAPPAIVTAA